MQPRVPQADPQDVTQAARHVPDTERLARPADESAREHAERSTVPRTDTLPHGGPSGPDTPPLGHTAIPMPEPGTRALKSESLFTVRDEISHGGMGRVSFAWDHNLQRLVAVKELLQARANQETAERFLREAYLTGGLEHPGIVPVHQFGVSGEGRLFYTMKYIGGQTLEAAIRELSGLPADALRFRRTLLLQRVLMACQAIAFAHTNGVIHRDIKPSNIMLGEFGETIVLDWGVAKRVALDETTAASCASMVPSAGRALPVAPPLPDVAEMPATAAAAGPITPGGDYLSPPTEQGSVIGTPAYMAPEQARGEVEALSPAADVFSLGATLYQVVTGHAPYGPHATDNVLEAAAGAAFRAPSELAPDVPAELEAIILRAMAADRRDRYRNACELACDLERYLAGDIVHAHHYSRPARLMHWLRKRRALVVGALLLGLATNVIGLTAAGLTLSSGLMRVLVWTADAQIRQVRTLVREWVEPAKGALTITEAAAGEYGTRRAEAESALEQAATAWPNAELLYYAIDDGRGAPFAVGSDPARPLPPDVDARSRPWYTAALAAGGAIAVSPPYADVNTGLPCISLSRLIATPDADGYTAIAAVDLNLQPLLDLVVPESYPQGGVVLVTAVRPAETARARWMTAEPIVLASTLAAEVFPTDPGDPRHLAAGRMVEIIRHNLVQDGGRGLPAAEAGLATPTAFEHSLIVHIAGREHAVFSAPVEGLPWMVSIIIPVETLSMPVAIAARVFLRITGWGLVVGACALGLYYGVFARRRRALAVSYGGGSLPPGFRSSR